MATDELANNHFVCGDSHQQHQHRHPVEQTMSAQPGIPQAKHCRRPSVNELQWQEQALCVEVDSEIFFPGKGDLSAARAAKRVCAMCEVRSECLDYSLRYNEIHGVWGGLTDRQRREYKRQRRDNA